jgi:drug/metabolite transporter (DMT)-like permease
MKKRTAHHLGVLALITAAALGGINNPMIRSALKIVPVYLFGFWRVGIALLIIGPLALYMRRRRPAKQKKISRKDLATIVVGSLMLFVGANLLFYLGLHQSTSINAAIISLLGPVLLFIISVEVYKETFNKKVFAGIGLSFLGASLVVLGPLIGQATAGSASTITGNVLLTLAVFVDVATILILKRVLTRVHILDVLGIGLLVSSAAYLVLALPYMDQMYLLAQPMVFKPVLYGAIVVGCFGYILSYYGISKTKGSDISITSYIGPVFGMATAVLFFNEQFTPSLMIGGIIVFTGLYLVEARNLVGAIHHGSHH